MSAAAYFRHHLKGKRTSIGRKYILPVGLGFLGMFICHIIILSGFGAGIQYPIYVFAYPIVHPLIAATLTWNSAKLWVSNAIAVCVLPFLYWYLLLWSDGKISLEDTVNWRASSGMLLIMPLTV